MTHEHDTARLSDYLDGELGSRAAARLEAHLAECPTCADALAELQAVRDAAGALPVIMATSNDRSESITRAMERRANDYITKPIKREAVFTIIEKNVFNKEAA